MWINAAHFARTSKQAVGVWGRDELFRKTHGVQPVAGIGDLFSRDQKPHCSVGKSTQVERDTRFLAFIERVFGRDERFVSFSCHTFSTKPARGRIIQPKLIATAAYQRTPSGHLYLPGVQGWA